jgi:small-conductance mechanosensitive channel
VIPSEDPLTWRLYNNAVGAWLIALTIAVCLLVAMLIVRRVARRRRTALAGSGPLRGDLPLDLIHRTRLWFLIVVALALGSLELVLPARWEALVRDAMVIALLLQVAIWGNGIIAFASSRYISRRTTPTGDTTQTPTTVAALSILARGVLWVLLGLIALDNLGVHITTLVAGLGISGVAIALAVQNILGDLFAALAIVLDKPFVVGDAITVDSLSGTVEKIGLKTTRVRADSGEQIIFSNADLLKSRVRNWRRLRERMITLSITVDGTTPASVLGRVPTIMRELITAQPQVRFDRSHVTAIVDGNVRVDTVYVVLTPDYGVYMNAQQAIMLGLLDRLRREHISIAAPLHAVTFRDGVRLLPPNDAGAAAGSAGEAAPWIGTPAPR